jgi:ABC-type Fe3+ transport system substrate-binding protein
MNVKRAVFATLAVGLLLSLLHAPAQAVDWKQDWKQTIAAANTEGQLVMSIPSGSVWRAELMRFQSAYPNIKVRMAASSGRDFWARFMKEREVGQFLWDLRIGGYDAQEYQIKQAGNMQSVRDLLVLPEVLDDSKWYGGLDGTFLDKEKRYILGFVAVDQTSARYNKKLVGDSFDARDLLDPKWAGKISMADPRGGSSLTGMGGIYRRFGPDFIRKLMLDQKPVITNVPRQQTDWLISGRYPIAFGVPSAALVEYGRNGGDISSIGNLTGVLQWSVGVGAISVPTKNPNPAATKVFVNWLLTKDVQAHIMKGVQLNSRRKDVPQGSPDLALDYSKYDEYYAGQAEDMKPYIEAAAKLLREIVAR